MSASPISTLPIGYKLASNTVLKLLGQGGYGATYVVSDVRAEGDMSVIKECLPSGLAFREESSQQILPVEATGEGVEKLRAAQEAYTAEAKALETLHHPSVVEVSRVFSALGTTYMTMEYLPGYTVAEWCDKNGAPTREQLSYLLTTLLSALKYLHGHGLAHGDIRAEHVRFRENGVPVLIDFGMARKTIQASTGSAEISALERTAEDLYALGAMARRLITGEDAASGSRPTPLVKNSKLVSTYGRSLLAGIDKAMSTTKDKGWASADEWLDAAKGRLLSAPTRRIFSKVAVAAAAVGVLGFGAYEGVQYLWNNAEDASTASNEPTQAEIARKAYTEGMEWLEKKGDREADPTKALPLLKKAAGLGHVGAMKKLAECYGLDSMVAQDDPEEEFHWASMAVQAGDSATNLPLARCYRDGRGTAKDLRAAVQHFLKIAQTGDTEAQYELALCYADEEGPCYNTDEVQRWLTTAGEKGHIPAQMTLARMYREGKFGRYREHDSFLWYQKAHEAGDPEATYELGEAYWEGIGIPPNREEAVKCFRQVAEKEPKAAARLGGILIKSDPQEAEKYLKMAAAAGMDGAQLALAELYVEGINGQRNEAAALSYFLQASQEGNVKATCDLAALWLSGYREGCDLKTISPLLERDAAKSERARLYKALLPGTPRKEAMECLNDLSKNASEQDLKADANAYYGLMLNRAAVAKDYYKLAADMHSELGESLLAYYTLKGGATGDTADEALRTLLRNVDTRAPYRPLLRGKLGELYLLGAKGVQRDTAKGLKNLEEAAASKDLDALHLLAKSYMEGTGASENDLPKDPEKGIRYYREAAAADSIPAAIFLGHHYFASVEGAPDYAAAEPYLRIAAEAWQTLSDEDKNDQSLYEYACCLAGKPEPDKALAFQYFTQYAATLPEKSKTAAAIRTWRSLATMLDQGDGAEKDPEKALAYWKAAADAGDVNAKFHYGLHLYENGDSDKVKKEGKDGILAANKAKDPEAAAYVEAHKELQPAPAKGSSKGSSGKGGNKGNKKKGRK